MALIRCKECNKEVSDTAKSCPHCGYVLQPKKNIFELIAKIKINNIDIIIAICMICMLILSYVDGTYTINWLEGYETVARHNYAIEDLLTYILPEFIFNSIVVIIIISFIIKVINYFNINKLDKIKNVNKYIFSIISIIYDVLVIYALTYVEFCGLKNGGYCYSEFGAYWVAFLAIISLILNVINLINNIKEKNSINNKE